MAFLEKGVIILTKSEEVTMCDRQLIDAARYGDLDKVKELIDNGANFNIKDGIFKKTPLYFAVCNGYLEIVKYLIDEKKADFNVKDNDGRTPLHLAASNGCLEIVKYLIDKKKVDFTIKSNFGDTPLCEAISAGWLNVAKTLSIKKQAST